MRDTETCVFMRRKLHNTEIAEIEITVATGLGPRSTRLRSACRAYARDRGCQLWTQPSVVPGRWLVYTIHGDASVVEYLTDMPTRDAAEMWMLHYGK